MLALLLFLLLVNATPVNYSSYGRQYKHSNVAGTFVISTVDTVRIVLLVLSIISGVGFYVAEILFRLGFHQFWKWLRILKRSEYIWFTSSVAEVIFIFVTPVKECPAPDVNPDITGTGVRVSAYAQNLVVVLCTFLGHYHTGQGGIKELGILQLFGLANLGFNILRNLRSINFVETMITCLLMDGISSALSVTLSSKNALAARRYVAISIWTQIFATIGQAFAISHVGRANQHLADRQSNQCCYQVVWWGTIDSCNGAPLSLWLYLTFRVAALLHTAWLACSFMDFFDRSEKNSRMASTRKQNEQNESDSTKLWTEIIKHLQDPQDFDNEAWTMMHVIRLCQKLNDTQNSVPLTRESGRPTSGTKRSTMSSIPRWVETIIFLEIPFATQQIKRGDYDRYAATTFTDYRLWIGPLLVSMCSAEQLRASYSWYHGRAAEWGQSATIVLLVCSIVHWVYVTVELLFGKGRDTRLPKREVPGHGRQLSLFSKIADFLYDALCLPRWLPAADILRFPSGRPDSEPLLLSQEEVPQQVLTSAKLRNLDEMESFLRYNPDLSIIDSHVRTSLLCKAMVSGRAKLAEALLLSQQDANAKYRRDIPLLHLAVLLQLIVPEASSVFISLLLDRGASINARTKDDLTALHAAAIIGSREIAELLLSKGAAVNAESRCGTTALHLAVAGVLNLDSIPKLAVNTRYTNLIEVLLRHGANVNCYSISLGNPLKAAVRAGAEELVAMLLAAGAQVTGSDGSSASTLLHDAVRMGNRSVAKLLVQNGAKVDQKVSLGGTPLQSAAGSGHIDVAMLLLEHGADVNSPGFCGHTALHAAASCGHEAMARLLLSHGANINAMDESGRTPRANAVFHKHQGTVDILDNWECDPHGHT